jgi:hypothetical protein
MFIGAIPLQVLAGNDAALHNVPARHDAVWQSWTLSLRRQA